jgi:hypothetical protein
MRYLSAEPQNLAQKMFTTAANSPGSSAPEWRPNLDGGTTAYLEAAQNLVLLLTFRVAADMARLMRNRW